MADMLKNVARAIYGRAFDDDPLLGELDSAEWALWLEVARSAIEALRVPTDDMVEAGYQTISCPTCGYSSLKEQAAINWQAMVDVASGREG